MPRRRRCPRIARLEQALPAPDQRRRRSQILFQFPERAGRSRHGHPAWTRNKTPAGHQPAITPPAPRPRMSGQQRLPPRPLRSPQVMTP